MGKIETTNIINEIKDLQYDLTQWIRGEIDDFSRISNRQAIDMTIINSKGMYETRTEFNARYQKNHGRYPNIKLSSEIIRIRRISDNMMLVSYKQSTNINGEEKLRVTSALFRYNQELKNNAEWLHVHVTMQNS